MKSIKNLLIALCGLVVLAILNYAAIIFYLFWTVWWFDFLMHFLGGLIGGYFSVWLLIDSGSVFREPPTRKTSLMLVLILVWIFLIGWEGVEYFYKLPQPDASYPIDTAIDILVGTLGTLVAYFSTTSQSRQSS